MKCKIALVKGATAPTLEESKLIYILTRVPDISTGLLDCDRLSANRCSRYRRFLRSWANISPTTAQIAMSPRGTPRPAASPIVVFVLDALEDGAEAGLDVEMGEPATVVVGAFTVS